MYLITGLGLGGAERQVRLLARELTARGWEVMVVSMLPLEREESDLIDLGVRVVSLNMRAGVPSPRAFLAFSRLLRRWRPQALHAQLVHANLMARFARLFVRAPVVVTSATSVHEGPAWRYLAYRATKGLADVSAAVSTAVANELVRRGAVAPGRILVVPNGIVTKDHRRDQVARRRIRAELSLADRFVWLAAGRLVPAKDYPSMLAAFKRVELANPASALLIAGEGPLEGELRDLVERLGLPAAVQLLGRRDDVTDLMSAADGYVMSSAWEGLPMALLEAAAASLPTVATEVAGNGEVVVHGESGILVPPGDSPALADAMEQVMSMTPETQAAMGEAARSRVATIFDLARVADRWETIYLGEAAYDSTVRAIPSSNDTVGT